MDKKLIVTVGISGSGKSTYAKQEFDKNPSNTIIVNRDKIRELLFGYTENTIWKYYYRNDLAKLEKQVTHYEDVLINEGLMQGKVVIVDATHLKKSYLKRFEYWNVPIEYEYFTVSIKDAVERINTRDRKISENIIKKQYDSYLNLRRGGVPVRYTPVTLILNTSLPDCYIFDIDGTLAHKGSRNAYDWKLVGNDAVDISVQDLFQSHTIQAKIICTGRDGVCEKETKQWLVLNGMGNYTEFHIRKQGDMRPDWVVKEEMWRDIATRYNIIYIVDDRNQVCRRARSLGLKVFQVEYGNF